MILKTLPVRAPNELRLLQWVRKHDGLDVSTSGYNSEDPATGQLVCGSFSYDAFRTFRKNVPQFSDMVGYARQELTVTANGASEFAYGHFVSGNYFTALGAQTSIGRPILNEDDAPGKPAVAVLTHSYWGETVRARSRSGWPSNPDQPTARDRDRSDATALPRSISRARRGFLRADVDDSRDVIEMVFSNPARHMVGADLWAFASGRLRTSRTGSAASIVRPRH